jgi:Predicted transcriptional regulators
MEDIRVWRALADPTRRALLDRLRAGPCTTGALAAGFPVTRFAVMKHLDVLVAAGLVLVERRGRERLNYLNPVPIRRVNQRWLAPFAERPTNVTPSRPDLAGPPEPAEPSGVSMDISAVLTGVIDVRTHTRIQAPRPTVYTSLLDIGSWWPHRFRDNSYVVLEPHVGGRFYEDWQNGGTLYGTVTEITEDERLTVTGAMGTRGAVTGRFTVELTDTDDGQTVVTVAHQAFGQIDRERSEEYRRGWDSVLAVLTTHVTARG